MVERRYIFPGVIELNVQARRRLGVNIYLIDGGSEYALIDVGFLDELADVLELIRQMDFSLSSCKMILATHADADHTQGLSRAREVLKCKVAAHPRSVAPLEEGDEVLTYARIDAQNIHIPMPRCKVDRTIDEGDVLTIGDRTLEVWSTPGHTAGQLSFRMGPLLFSGDNIFRDGCVGVIDAHHGSNLVDFIASLRRIRDCDATFLLPSHGPIFRKDDQLLERTIARLESYTHMADFGTCAIDWPLLDQWEDELASGKLDLG
jgi:glyoxylase-like metal-dependent hydrolase (beta-lactamase superfamily II)